MDPEPVKEYDLSRFRSSDRKDFLSINREDISEQGGQKSTHHRQTCGRANPVNVLSL